MAKILIIEDNVSLSEVYRLILEREGHIVIAAFNGRQGLAMLKPDRPDLVVLDMMMPVMTGLDFLKRYQRLKPPRAPVMILSNLDEDKEVREALRLGASRYVIKADVSPKELAEHVRSVIEKYGWPKDQTPNSAS